MEITNARTFFTVFEWEWFMDSFVMSTLASFYGQLSINPCMVLESLL